MLTLQENDLLCRTGAGTPMGDLMRRYWLPALISSELPGPDCPPVRVLLLGEQLIAFRVTSGKIGLIANACPHRRASLFFGRNHEEGLRCVYHGWKYNTDGQCVDMPSEPEESNFKEKIRTTVYPCVERNGIVWTYMGPRKELPPLPDLEPNMMPEGQWSVTASLRGCNWAQALEGDIDTSHLAFLHLGAVMPESVTPGSFDYYTVNDRAPRHRVVETEFGTSYGAYRPAEEDTYYWRTAHFLSPFYTMIPTGELGRQVLVRAWVPMDDEHTMFFWTIAGPSSRGGGGSPRRDVRGQPLPGTVGDNDPPNSTDWLGRWRLATNADNDYLIDREAQRTVSYSGISGIQQQDQAITESMGPISDRANEHLGAADAMVIRTRQRILRAARELREGTEPPGVDNPDVYRVRSGGIVLPRTTDWWEATAELRKAFVDHPESASS